MIELKEMCKALLSCLNLSQKDFGKIIGSTQTEVSFIENGFIPPHPKRITIINLLYDLHIKNKGE